MKKKIFIAIGIAVFCTVAIVLGVLFATSVIVNTADKALTPSEVFTVNIPEHSTGVKLISEVIEGEAMPYEMRSGYAFIAAYYLQAEVTGVENTSVTYSVAYKDGTAVESDVVSYMFDGSSIFIGFHKKFNQTVVVTATSNANPYAFATCEIDCYKKYTGSNFIIDFCGSTTYVEDGETYYIDSDYQLSEDYFSVISDSQYFGSYGSDYGGPESEHLYFYLTTEAVQALEKNNISYNDISEGGSLYNLFCSLIPSFESYSNFALSALSEVNTIFCCEITGEWWDEYYREETCGRFYVGGFDFSEYYLEPHEKLVSAHLVLHSLNNVSYDSHFSDGDIINLKDFSSDLSELLINVYVDYSMDGGRSCADGNTNRHFVFSLTDEAKNAISSYCDINSISDMDFDYSAEFVLSDFFANVVLNEDATLNDVFGALASCEKMFSITVDVSHICLDEGEDSTLDPFTVYISGCN